MDPLQIGGIDRLGDAALVFVVLLVGFPPVRIGRRTSLALASATDADEVTRNSSDGVVPVHARCRSVVSASSSR